ncbi:MAG: TPM domain-containing protein [Crocosphaera sp.]|nr:TPM domain-containing protein [Crocosphaera sp.]
MMNLQLVKLKQILLISFICLTIFFNPLPSLAITPQEVPNPKIESGRWVSDVAEILSPTTENQLNKIIDRLETLNGSEMAIVTVSETSGVSSPKAFATELFNDWGIGKKAENNGVLLLISVKDRRVEIETGYGLQEILPDVKVQEIIDTTILPKFKEGNFDLGTVEGTKRIVVFLAPSLTEELDKENQSALSIGNKVKLGILIAVAAICLLWIWLKDLIIGTKVGRGSASRSPGYAENYGDGCSGGGSFGGGSSGGDGAGGGW